MAKKDESKFKIKVPKVSVAKKSYSFTLSLPGMISAVGAGVLALTFFFVMGILIGRGYRPEADVPQLKEIMPTQQYGQMGEPPLEPEILKPEELDYADRVKQDPGKVMDQPVVETRPEEKKAETKPEIVPAPEMKQEQPQVEVTQPAQPKPGEPVFDYIYQVASFKKHDMAEALSAKLQKAGLNPFIKAGDVKGVTWYRVYVNHRGTPDSTDAMKAALAKVGVGKPLMLKKTPVE